MDRLIISRDEIPTYIPRSRVRLIVLGTMGAINARTIDDRRPTDIFFYNDNRNQFWKVLQLLLEPASEAATLSLPEKKAE
ncbi:MAG: hypothetical protein AAB250_10260 [Bdellovibrionota bacterium]